MLTYGDSHIAYPLETQHVPTSFDPLSPQHEVELPESHDEQGPNVGTTQPPPTTPRTL